MNKVNQDYGAQMSIIASIFRLLVLILTVACAFPYRATAQTSFAIDRRMLDLSFPYEASDVQVKLVLQDIMVKTGIPIIVSDQIRGTASLMNDGGSVRDALQRLTESGTIIWWFDGRAVHIEPPANMDSRLIALNGFSIDELRAQIVAVGLDNAQYPLHADSNAEMARIVAPAGYADAIAELAAHMSEARMPKRPENRDGPIIIRGRAQERH